MRLPFRKRNRKSPATRHADTPFELVSLGSEITGRSDDTWVMLVPDGRVRSSKGDYVLDANGGRQAVEAFNRTGNDLVIDYEHQTLGGKYSSPSGKAPAAGWVTALRYTPGRGLLGHVKWTDDGFDAISTSQYKYLSPVVAIRKADRHVAALHSAALTNVPAIHGMERLAASQGVEDFMETLTLAGGPAPNPPPDSGGGGGDPEPADTTNPNRAPDDKIMAAMRELALLLGLPETARVDDVVSALSEWGDLAEGGEEGEAVARSASMIANRVRAEVKTEYERAALIDQAQADGKIMPYMVEWAERLGASNPDALKAFCEMAPNVGPPTGRTKPPGGDRPARSEAVKRQAIREFQSSTELQALTTERAFVNMKMREADLRPTIKQGEELVY